MGITRVLIYYNVRWSPYLRGVYNQIEKKIFFHTHIHTGKAGQVDKNFFHSLS